MTVTTQHSANIVLRRVLPGNLASADQACREVLSALSTAGLHRDAFAVQLLLRETLTNAVIHGSQEDERQVVVCEVRLRRDWLTIRVTDEGPGFDWRARLQQRPAPLDEQGWGLHICSMYAAALTFNRRGNRVTVKRKLGSGRLRCHRAK